VLWRFARCWALLDGIEVPENMNRCINNTYNFEGFWRMWHRSFNQWLIRYIFIPLGGNKYKHYNIWAVFTFVAIWHDMNLNLILWAWMLCIVLMPEVLLKKLFNQDKFDWLREKIWWKYVCAFACTVEIIPMAFSNLIGFGFGYEGAVAFWTKMWTFSGKGSLHE
jgi:D-alanyl-lipoteichoic acid acyltransferase DltB (MBOAT superfamily)